MAYETIDFLISLAIFLISFTIGLSINFEEFKRIFKHPKKLLIGSTSQIILLPILAFLILLPFNLLPEIKIGIMILAACPGGATTNFITYLIKGNTSLSISLTGLNTIITLFSIPLITNFSLFYFLNDSASIHLSLLKTIIILLSTILIPCLIGVLIREYRESSAKKIEIYFKILSIIFLAIVFSIKLFAKNDLGGSGITFANILYVLPILLIIHVASLFMGFFIPKLFKIDNKSSITTGIEVGSQNTSLAILVGGTLLGNNLIIIPALVYALFSFYTTLIFGILMKKSLVNKKIREKIKIYEPL